MLILASSSPRRQELLRNAGIEFQILPADIAEEVRSGETARERAERLAREKALAVAAKRPNDVVLGADTVVVVDTEILGKPVDAEDAHRMLRLLSGRTHQVITGVCLVKAVASGQYPVASGQCSVTSNCSQLQADGKRIMVSSETTNVTMTEISDEEIRKYVATGEPMDKAGAYPIQGWASRWIPRIEGDYSNVVGLPVALVWRMLRELGEG